MYQKQFRSKCTNMQNSKTMKQVSCILQQLLINSVIDSLRPDWCCKVRWENTEINTEVLLFGAAQVYFIWTQQPMWCEIVNTFVSRCATLFRPQRSKRSLSKLSVAFPFTLHYRLRYYIPHVQQSRNRVCAFQMIWRADGRKKGKCFRTAIWCLVAFYTLGIETTGCCVIP